MVTDSVDVSVVIVNWRSAEYVYRCLDSLFSQDQHVSFEVLVVDNGSLDLDKEKITRGYPKVALIESSENLGFGAANNLGYAVSRGHYLLFLNPDTELVGPVLGVLSETLAANPRGGVAGCRLLNSDGTLQIGCVKSFPTIMSEVFETDLIKKTLSRLRTFGLVSPCPGKGVRSVDVVSGACLMVRRHVFDEVGGFGKDYFIYSEDVDLCYKIKRLDYQVLYTDRATVVHHGGRSTSSIDDKAFSIKQQIVSRHLFFVKTRSRAYAHSYAIAMIVIAVLRVNVLFSVLGFLLLMRDGTRRIRCTSSLQKWCGVLVWLCRTRPFRRGGN